MAEIERDALRELDWSKVYADVPGEVRDGAKRAFARIRQRELKRRRAIRIAAAAAACAVLAAGASVWLLRGREAAPDSVAPLAPGAIVLGGGDEVYASRADGCFHVRRDCPRAAGECVALQLVTALEFGKELCPDCGANYTVEPSGEGNAR